MTEKEGVRVRLFAADCHKATHSVAAVDVSSGRVLAERQFAADQRGMTALLRWSRSFGSDRLFALEDTRNVSGGLERRLLSAGHRVIRVPPRLTATARKREREPGKSDFIDARSVARAVLERGIETFPTATRSAQAEQTRVLVDYRTSLIQERTRLECRLRWHLVELAPQFEAQIKRTAFKHAGPMERIARELQDLPQCNRLAVAQVQLRRIEELTRDARTLEHELEVLVMTQCPALLELPGCGVLSAATFLGRVPNARSYPTDGHFARLAGVAPIEYGSGSRTRRLTYHGGDRQLNAALHRIAATQVRVYPPAQEYIARKRSEGKTGPQAMRCLKRRIARRVWQILKTRQATAPTRIPSYWPGTSPVTTMKPMDGVGERRNQYAPDLQLLADVREVERTIRGRILERLAELEPLVSEYQEHLRAAQRLGLYTDDQPSRSDAESSC